VKTPVPDAATADNGFLVEASDLSKRYSENGLVLDALNVGIRPGEVYCLFGANGAGKTTAIHLFLGLVRPTMGRATIAGIDAAHDPVGVRRHVTYISTRASLCPSLTARQNVEFFTHVGTPRKSLGRFECYNAMRRMGIPEDSLEQKVTTLPKETRLQVWLAIAWLRQSPVLLLDDPTTGLDIQALASFQEHLAEFRNEGRATLLATADVFLASQVCDRIAILKNGRTIAERTRAQILVQSLTELYLDYGGRPSAVSRPENRSTVPAGARGTK